MRSHDAVAIGDLKEKAIRGGFARICAQGAHFLVRIGSIAVLGRLLNPMDFGLVGMVTAFVGVLDLFRDFGLSTATVQRTSVTEDQLSTLFWINMLVGGALGLVSVAIAPVVAHFYHEPRLLWITVALAPGFILNSAGVQHTALLQRQMRFTALAVIGVLSRLVSTAVGIVMALKGYGYWALVGTSNIGPVLTTVGAWLCTKWIPGIPRKQAGTRSMMRFGGTITLNGLVVYVAYNLEKVLLGRFWGAGIVGIYGRAYQLVNIPTENLNASVGEVAFAALSRLQGDPIRLKSYFLKGYSLVLAITLPITLLSAVFADDLILVLLGPKWTEAGAIFRLLTPTILIFALINPLAWLLFSLGLVARSLKIALVIAPLVIGGYLVGLPYGAKGVAFAYSAVMTLWLVPHIIWCVRGTAISVHDIALTVSRPLISGVVAGIVAFGAQLFYGHLLSPLPRLILGCVILLCIYLGMLMYVMQQKAFYEDLFRGLLRRSSPEEKALASA